MTGRTVTLIVFSDCPEYGAFLPARLRLAEATNNGTSGRILPRVSGPWLPHYAPPIPAITKCDILYLVLWFGRGSGEDGASFVFRSSGQAATKFPPRHENKQHV